MEKKIYQSSRKTTTATTKKQGAENIQRPKTTGTDPVCVSDAVQAAPLLHPFSPRGAVVSPFASAPLFSADAPAPTNVSTPPLRAAGSGPGRKEGKKNHNCDSAFPSMEVVSQNNS